MERYTELRKISIHTFLAEGDRWEQPRKNSRSYFNPHLPYGRWLAFAMLESMSALFQSTPSLRKVTRGTLLYLKEKYDFNPHLPYGRWPPSASLWHFFHYFNPHLPYGRWRETLINIDAEKKFQSTIWAKPNHKLVIYKFFNSNQIAIKWFCFLYIKTKPHIMVWFNF